MSIPRVKGKRREIRRMLAQRSKELLAQYRRGEVGGEDCPLMKALDGGGDYTQRGSLDEKNGLDLG